MSEAPVHPPAAPRAAAPTPGPVRPGPVAAAAAADVLAVLLFALAGRRSHAGDGDLAEVVRGVLGTAGPLLVGLAVAWAAARVWQDPRGVRRGAVVWAVVVVVGLVLRGLGTGRVPPLSFALVTTGVLAALLLGWRGVLARARG